MALNEVLREAEAIALPVPAGTASGAPVKVGGFVGVTQTAEGGGGNLAGYATVWCEGAYKFTVSFAVANVGDAVYIDSNNALTATASGNTLFGYALNTKGATSGSLTVAIHRY